jgi:3-oxoadipate enol-lactonase
MPHANVNGVNLYYEIHGNGEPIVCATGWGLLTGSRITTIPEQLRENYQLIVYDHRGIGQSEKGPDVHWTTELFASDVSALMDHLGLERTHIFGRGGLGACIMQHVALKNPERVQSVVLSGGWPGPEPHHEAMDEMFLILREKVGFEAFQLFGALICYTAEHFNENQERLLSPNGPWSEVRDHPEEHIRLIKAVIEHDARDRLGELAVPVLLIHGDETDILSGPRLGRLLQSYIPGAELEILEGAPHSIPSVPSAQHKFGELALDFYSRHSISE